MKAKKGLAIAMAALLSLTALAGCSGGAKEAPAAQQKAADTAAGDTKAEQPDNAAADADTPWPEDVYKRQAQVSSVSIIKNTLFIFGFIIPVIKSSV